MRKLIGDLKSEDQLSEVENAKQKSLKNVTKFFFFFWGGGSIISQKSTVIRWLILYSPNKAMGCNMSLKLHFVDSLLSFLPRKSRGSER